MLAAAADANFSVPRHEPHERFEDGTLNFYAICGERMGWGRNEKGW